MAEAHSHSSAENAHDHSHAGHSHGPKSFGAALAVGTALNFGFVVENKDNLVCQTAHLRSRGLEYDDDCPLLSIVRSFEQHLALLFCAEASSLVASESDSDRLTKLEAAVKALQETALKREVSELKGAPHHAVAVKQTSVLRPPSGDVLTQDFRSASFFLRAT